MKWEFWVPGLASTWSVPRINRYGGSVKSEALTAYQEKVATFAKEAGCKPILGPVGARYCFIVRKPKRSAYNYPKRKDLTNLVKATEDGLNHIAWQDDSQVVEMAAEKRYARKDEEDGVRILVASLEPGVRT
jgi:Holliday junction resolvase RusA-like endonuclease